jgi:hypothetical protein
LLGACGFVDDDGASHELRTSLHQSVTAASGMRPAAAPGAASAVQALAIPATPDILKALTAGNVEELERLLGGLQAAYEGGDLPQGRL